MWKRELVALLSLSPRCLVIAVWLFLAVPWVSLQVVNQLSLPHQDNCKTRRDIKTYKYLIAITASNIELTSIC